MVTAVFGFDLDDQALEFLAKELKRHCGTGGSVRDGVIVIQGDLRDTVKGFLEGKGFRVKIDGEEVKISQLLQLYPFI
jgi:translation initiation factor 1